MNRLDEIRKRAEAATPGPWALGGIARPKGVTGPHCRQSVEAGPRHTVAVTFRGQWRRRRREGEESNYVTWHRCEDGVCRYAVDPNSDTQLDTQNCPDADFIANAREDIPYLLDEIERLREAIRTALDTAEQNVDDPDTVLIDGLRAALEATR